MEVGFQSDPIQSVGKIEKQPMFIHTQRSQPPAKTLVDEVTLLITMAEVAASVPDVLMGDIML